MKTFALIFAWLPIAMAFMGSGQEGAGYVWNSLLLLWFGVEVCSAAYRYGIELSWIDIQHQFKMDFAAAVRSGDYRSASVVMDAAALFAMRGAS